MAILSLQITDFRCIERAELEFASQCTVITGDNAAGKTSVLEAIYVLSSGRSFRTTRNELLIRNGQPEFLISGRAARINHSIPLGLRSGRASREIHVDGVKARGLADLAAALPVQVIGPGAHKLLEEGPALRRKFMDWGVFHVEPQFLEAWRAYHRALSQRNSALKAQQSHSLVRSWDEQLVNAGDRIANMRQRYLTGLSTLVERIASELLGVSTELELKQGWEGGRSLAEGLVSAWPRDLKYRSTTAGPHRADMEIRTDGFPARDRVSRGQQKLLACALVLAQLRYRIAAGLPPACLLLDDPAAELDVHNLGKLLRLVTEIPAQLVIAAVDSNTVEMMAPQKKFHVKQGLVAAVL